MNSCLILRSLLMASLLAAPLAGSTSAHAAANESAALQRFRTCAATAYNSPENALIRPHIPFLITNASPNQLADTHYPTDEEIRALAAIHPQTLACRLQLLEGLSQTDPALATRVKSLYAKTESLLTELTQRKLTWGEYITQLSQLTRQPSAENRPREQADKITAAVEELATEIPALNLIRAYGQKKSVTLKTGETVALGVPFEASRGSTLNDARNSSGAFCDKIPSSNLCIATRVFHRFYVNPANETKFVHDVVSDTRPNNSVDDFQAIPHEALKLETSYGFDPSDALEHLDTQMTDSGRFSSEVASGAKTALRQCLLSGNSGRDATRCFSDSNGNYLAMYLCIGAWAGWNWENESSPLWKAPATYCFIDKSSGVVVSLMKTGTSNTIGPGWLVSIWAPLVEAEISQFNQNAQTDRAKQTYQAPKL